MNKKKQKNFIRYFLLPSPGETGGAGGGPAPPAHHELNATPALPKIPVAPAEKVIYTRVVLFKPSPLAEKLATMRAAAMPDPAHGGLATAVHALIATFIARLLDLVLLWQSGQLPPPPARHPTQPRRSTPAAARRQSPTGRRTRVRRAAPATTAAPRAARAKNAHGTPACTASPRRHSARKPHVSPAARAPPPHPGFRRMNGPGGAAYTLINNVAIS